MMGFDYPKVEILLATYNGERFLEHLIKSILNQSYINWYLLIRDDVSTDNTIKIINKLKKDYSNKVKVIENNKKRLGACQNFHELLKYSTAKYLFFCDQDDIWLKNKIEISMKKMLDLEKKYGKNYPILIHTNLKLINSSNNIISNSFWTEFSIHPEKMYIPEILFFQNIITGCTILINETAKKKVLPIPKKARMHDSWVSVKLVKYGKIANINTPTILYRQHDYNTIGINKLGVFSSLIPNTLVAFKHFLKEFININKLLDYKINFLKAIWFQFYFSFERYKNVLKKKRWLIFFI